MRHSGKPLLQRHGLAGFSAVFGAGLAFVLAGCGGGGSSATAPIADTPVAPLSTLTLSLPGHGLAPSQLAVIVAAGDPVSEAAAASYQARRGVPDANIIRITLPTTADAISDSDFGALKAAIDAKLPAGVQATLLTWSAPSRVAGASCTMSITSAMAFGYAAGYCNSSTTNSCQTTTASAYFDSESQAPFADLGIRPSMMLARGSAAAADALIARGASADGTAPAGTGWLVRTSDANRSVRFVDFSGLPNSWADTLALNYVDNSRGLSADEVSGKTDVMFYFTGLASLAQLPSNSYRPGAVGDALTSLAGVLPDGRLGQTPVTAWLDAGLTAAYGTVEEPCNVTEKFPKVSVLIDQYWRGATLIEAYWKSVATPGQGLFVGEPLARPWPDAPSFVISGDNYAISSRAFRAGGRYSLDYRTSTTGGWTTLASFTAAARARSQTFTAPRPPATAVQLRWMGPCPTNAAQSCELARSS